MASGLYWRLSRKFCGNFTPIKHQCSSVAWRQPHASVRLHGFSTQFQSPAILPKTRPYISTRLITTSLKASFITTVGLGLAGITYPKTVNCDTDKQVPSPDEPEPTPPQSIVSAYEITFGAVTGFCAGVFIKKGVRAVAWFLGGIFVILQFLASRSIVRVNWGRVGIHFEELFYTTDQHGARRAPTLASIWTRLLDFLTADFQPRATFIAGLIWGYGLHECYQRLDYVHTYINT